VTTNELALDTTDPVVAANAEPQQPARPGTLPEAQMDVLVIMNLIHALGRARTPDDVARAALETVRRTFGWAYGSYWILGETSNALRFVLESGSLGEEFQRVTSEARFREVGGLLRRTLRSRELQFVEDLSDIADCARARAAQEAGVKSGFCFPILVRGEGAGVMDFLTLETVALSPERLAVLRYVGQLVSAAVERLAGNQKQNPAAGA
jgi:GAF domain-containing protein